MNYTNGTNCWAAETKLNASRHILAGPTVETGRENQTIGCEIEFFNVNVSAAIMALRLAGLPIRNYNGYGHDRTAQTGLIPTEWKIVFDSSVTSTNTGVGNGLELVSPPLKADAMNKQLKIALDTLKRIGAKVDKSCGVHIHHDAKDLELEQIKNVYRLYNKYHSYINEMMPESRCQPNAYRADGGTNYCRPVDSEWMEKVELVNSMETFARLDRYRTVNMESYSKYNTVEFRQMNGSLEFDKVWNWMMITQAMVATAKAKKEIRSLGKSQNLAVAFTTELKLVGTEQSAYTLNRRKELKEAAAKRAERAATAV